MVLQVGSNGWFVHLLFSIFLWVDQMFCDVLLTNLLISTFTMLVGIIKSDGYCMFGVQCDFGSM